jgi:hypothetical protein
MTKIIYAYMQAYQEDMTAKISQPVERATDPQSQKAVGKVKKYFQHLIE